MDTATIEQRLFSERENSKSRENPFQQAVELKEELPGRQHPDVGKSLTTLGDVLKQLGRPQRRSKCKIVRGRFFAPVTETLYNTLNNRGEALIDSKQFS